MCINCVTRTVGGVAAAGGTLTGLAKGRPEDGYADADGYGEEGYAEEEYVESSAARSRATLPPLLLKMERAEHPGPPVDSR